MKLLKKSEILSLKEAEKKQAIEEGLLIANRIDSLRETHAQEEKSLLDFRNATVKNINEEISKLSQEKGSLIFQVEKLKKEREVLMKPVEEEWIQIAEAQSELSVQFNELAFKENELNIKISNLEKQIKENNKLKKKLESLISQKNKEYEDFLNEKFAQKEERERLNKQIKNTELLKENVHNDLKERDAELAIKERHLKINEEKLAKAQEQLRKDRIKLEDRKEMFKRRINRLKK